MKKSKNKINESEIYITDIKDMQVVKNNMKPDDKLYVIGNSETSKVNEEKEINNNTLMIVEYYKDMEGETPFIVNGIKWMYVWGKYPNGKIDIAVYRFDHNLTYGYDWFKSFILNKQTNLLPKKEIGEDINSPTSTTNNNQNGITHKFQKDVDDLFQKIVDNGNIKSALSKISTPVEKYEAIVRFAELIGVPNDKLGMLINDIKNISTSNSNQTESVKEESINSGNRNNLNENKNPRMTKAALANYIIKLNKNV